MSAAPADHGVRKEVITPEGVPLGFTLAQGGDRAAAFLIDMVVIYAAVAVVLGLSQLAAGAGGGNWARPFAALVVFFAQNFYFVFFELRWQGSTPGKRVVGIRVIDGRGGVLGARAVIARNLMRDVEVFIALHVVITPEALWPSAPHWATFLACGWVAVFAFLPLCNRDRLRAGDLVAGTLVVLAPKAVLLPDLSGEPGTGADPRGYRFTAAQLDIYGIYELQVLEDVLRRDNTTVEEMQALEVVCDQIKRKIAWDKARWSVDAERFLRDFYTAMRAHLERKMLFGKRKEDKHSSEN